MLYYPTPSSLVVGEGFYETGVAGEGEIKDTLCRMIGQLRSVMPGSNYRLMLLINMLNTFSM